MRVQVDLEWCALRNALFFEHEETIEKEQEIVEVPGNVEGCPPLDEADVFRILSTQDHKLAS